MSEKRDLSSRTGLVGEGLGESSQPEVDFDQGVDLGPGVGQSFDLRVFMSG